MKILTGKDNLAYAVQIVQRAVSLRNPLPILSGILLKTENNLLKVSATDLEIGLECSIPVTVIEEGAVVLPAKYLSEIVRKLPDSKIELEVTEGNTILKYGSSKFNLKNMPAEDFPQIIFNQSNYSYQIKEELFKNMIRQVVFATSTDETRPIFTGVLMEIDSHEIKLVASDTHRLALRVGKLNNSYSDNISIIVPGRALNEMSKITSGDDEEVLISVNEHQILFEKQNIKLTSRLIQGQFPNYKQIIPQQFQTDVNIKNKELLEAIERAALVAREVNNAVKISVLEDNVIVNSNSPDVGQVEEIVPANLRGETTQIAFNSKYLIDVLKVIDSEDIKISLTGSLSPGIVMPASSNNYIYLILPVRTN